MKEYTYLQGMSKFTQNILASAFAQAVQEATFSPRNYKLLVEVTVVTTISYVAHAFRSNNWPDPRLDRDGKTCFLLQKEFRGYKNTNAKVKKQKALPLSVWRKLHNLAHSNKDKAISWLLIGAIFFAMRSCEYLKTGPEESKQTKIIRLRNIIFKKDGKNVDHSDGDLPSVT